MNKFIFEYPKDWVKMADSQNIAFLNNINLCLIELNQLVSSIPVGYPSYGIARPHTEGPYLSFHSYNNPEGVWSYKEAPIKGLYSIDPKGYGGWSDIAKNPAKYQHEINNIANYDEILQPFINQLKQGISKYKQSKTTKKAGLPTRNPTLIFSKTEALCAFQIRLTLNVHRSSTLNAKR